MCKKVILDFDGEFMNYPKSWCNTMVNFYPDHELCPSIIFFSISRVPFQ